MVSCDTYDYDRSNVQRLRLQGAEVVAGVNETLRFFKVKDANLCQGPLLLAYNWRCYSSFLIVLAILKLLAELGYNIKAQGHLILQDLADSGESLDWLLDKGVDINRTECTRLDSGFCLHEGGCDYSLHVLSRVAARGDIQLFEHLVSRGADPSRSFAPHCASQCQDPQITTAMISHLVDKRHLDINADTDALRDVFNDSPDSGRPLNCAIYNQNLPAVQELLKKGACPSNFKRDPLHHAIGYALFLDEFLPALEPLLNAGADSAEALEWVVVEDRVEAAMIRLECGADPSDALEREQARANKAATEQDFHSEEDRGISSEMKKLLEDWKHVGENTARNEGRPARAFR